MKTSTLNEKTVSQNYKLKNLSKALLGKSTFEKTTDGFNPRAYQIIKELKALDVKTIKSLIDKTISEAIDFANEYEKKKEEKAKSKTKTVKKTVISKGGKLPFTKEQLEALKALLG